MGGKQSLLTDQELDDYQTLTFLTRQEILQVLERYQSLVSSSSRTINGKLSDWRLSKKRAGRMHELCENPFRDRIVDVFSSQPDGSFTFEDFLDMISVFSENAPKSVKVSYAFKIYQGIYKGNRPNGQPAPQNAIDLYDVREIVYRLSGTRFSDQELTTIAEAVIKEVDLRDDKIITAEIFEYFLSNVPDFPSSFVIPLSDGTEDRHVNPADSVQPVTTTEVRYPKKTRARQTHVDN